MSAVNWRPVGTVDPQSLGESRVVAHSALQWLARLALSYVEPVDDQSHTNLGWDEAMNALETREIAPGVTVELRLPDFTMQFKEEGERTTHEIFLDDRSPAAVEAWILIELLHRHMDRDRFSKDLPYDVPNLMVGDAVEFFHDPHIAELAELTAWFANANAVLSVVKEEYASVSPGPSEVRCWPHHFDMATLISFETGDPEKARSIGVGLSPGDEHYDEPYFYVSPYPRLSPWELPDLHDLGHWHKKGFVGAVAPASRIVEKSAGADDVLEFLRTSIETGKTKLEL